MRAGITMIPHPSGDSPVEPPRDESPGDTRPVTDEEGPISLDPEFLAWLEELL